MDLIEMSVANKKVFRMYESYKLCVLKNKNWGKDDRVRVVFLLRLGNLKDARV